MMKSSRPSTPQDVFTRLATRYDTLNAFMSAGRDTRWRRQATQEIVDGGIDDILDLCCGTGVMGEVLRTRFPQSHLVGVDVNHAMLEVARTKRPLTYNQLVRAKAEQLPLDTNSVDLVVLSLGFHDLSDQAAALSEIQRVLRPGGALLLLELTLPDNSVARRVYVGALRTGIALRNLVGLRRLGHVMDEVAASPPHSHIWTYVRGAGLVAESQHSHSGGLMTSYLVRNTDPLDHDCGRDGRGVLYE